MITKDRQFEGVEMLMRNLIKWARGTNGRWTISQESECPQNCS